MKRKTFLVIAFLMLAAALAYILSMYVLPKFTSGRVGPGLVLAGAMLLYFVIAYVIVFAGAIKTNISEKRPWPLGRCYGLILWGLLTIHLDAFIPAFGVTWQGRYQTACVVIDLFFLARILIAQSRRETGWQWQVYAMLYVWLPVLTRAVLVRA